VANQNYLFGKSHNNNRKTRKKQKERSKKEMGKENVSWLELRKNWKIVKKPKLERVVFIYDAAN